MKLPEEEFQELLSAVPAVTIKQQTSVTRLSYGTEDTTVSLIIEVSPGNSKLVMPRYFMTDVIEESIVYKGEVINIDRSQWELLCNKMLEKFIKE